MVAFDTRCEVLPYTYTSYGYTGAVHLISSQSFIEPAQIYFRPIIESVLLCYYGCSNSRLLSPPWSDFSVGLAGSSAFGIQGTSRMVVNSLFRDL
ncbi:hypothetical protein N665_0044s0005 [Sinapis alba]|nr:hypothetical protein N665_0044s0005 [Sinapis alba]